MKPNATIATISREKQHKQPYNNWLVGWKWLYSVTINGETTVVGHGLDVAMEWAKRRAPKITKNWQAVNQ